MLVLLIKYCILHLDPTPSFTPTSCAHIKGLSVCLLYGQGIVKHHICMQLLCKFVLTYSIDVSTNLHVYMCMYTDLSV